MQKEESNMVLKFSRKIKSPTYVELPTDRGHPGPKILSAYYGIAANQFLFPGEMTMQICIKKSEKVI
jgi:hypothetical protein